VNPRTHFRLISCLKCCAPPGQSLRDAACRWPISFESAQSLAARARGCAILAVVSSFAVIPVAHPAPASASLSYPTKEAYERYVALTDARNVAEVREGGPFLWVDTLPQARREETYNALKRERW